jgi:Tfp pilus assembly PilM family ATPase
VARTVVIDWQRDSLLVAVGVRRGASVAFEQIRLLPLGESESGTVTAGQALRKAIQEMGLGKAEAVVIASREVVEIRTLSVPNVEANELPDIIRFQAQRQMANMGETWPLDYILLPSAGLENKVALAGAISPAHLAEIDSAVIGAGLQLTRVVLRPLEIARFALTADATGKMKEGTSVVVCLTDHQADLLLLNAGALVQLRSTRLPTDSQMIAGTIVGEIKRSLVAASSQMNGVNLSSALLIAPAELAGKVESAFTEAAGCNAAVIDPQVMLPTSYEGAERLTHEAANRLAAIAGVVGSPQPDKRTLIDFKNPKKRPPKEVNFKRYVLVGAAAGLLLLAAGSWWYSTNSSMDRELAAIRQEIADKKGPGELALKQIAEYNEVKKLLDASPSWLDEVERIAMHKPSSDKVIMFSPTFAVAANGEGVIKSKVFGISHELISEFENALRKDDMFRVNSTGISETKTWPEYPWETSVTINVVDRGWKLLDDAKTQAAKKPEGEVAGQAVPPLTSAETKAEEKAESTPPAEATQPEASQPEAPKSAVPPPEASAEPKANEPQGNAPEIEQPPAPAPTAPKNTQEVVGT